MSEVGNSFYEQMSQANFLEKTASSQQVEDALKDINPDMLAKLASEIDDQAQKQTLEQSASDPKKDEDSKDNETSKDKDENSKSEDGKENKEAEEEGEDGNKESGSNAPINPSDKPSGDNSPEKTDEEVKQAAYEYAERRLEKMGYTLEDYVFSKTADEEVAEVISKKASAISELFEKTALEVADDILEALNAKLV